MSQEQQIQREQLEKIIWNEEAKKVLSEVYEIWDQIERKHTLELKPKIKELEYVIVQNIQKHGLGDSKLVLSLVADLVLSKIAKDGKDQTFSLRSLVNDILDKEHIHIELSNLRSQHLPEECSIFSKKALDGPAALKGKFPEHFGVRNFQEIAQQYHDSIQRIEKQADDYGIPLPYQTDELREKKPHIRLKPAGIPKEEQIRLYQDYLVDLKKADVENDEKKLESIKEYNYVSDIPETEQENIFKSVALHKLNEPIVDKKWQRDWGEWCDILWNYDDQGGTYASSKSAVDSTLEDPKTGKLQRRKVTKEQIDAKRDDYLNDMCFMIRHLKKQSALTGTAAGKKSDEIAFYETQPDEDSDELPHKYVKVEKYKLTKGQLGPSMSRLIIKEMRELIEGRVEIKKEFERFREKERAFRATRCIELHDVLSEAA